LLTALAGSQPLPAQERTLMGRVVDEVTGTPLEYANVFLARTTSGTSTDETGRFVLSRIPPGVYELVVSRVGYHRVTERVDLSKATQQVFEFRLQPADLQSDEVEISGTEQHEWKRNLQLFTDAFVGRTANASQCRILNPTHLDFHFDSDLTTLTASCDTLLLLENRALGYLVAIELDRFSWNVERDGGEFVLYPQFSPLTPQSPDDSLRWADRRRETYEGSLKHFLASTISGSVDAEMFAPYLRIPLVLDTLLDCYRLEFSGWVQVDYLGRAPRQQSYMALTSRYALADKEGNLIAPLSVRVRGAWGRYRMADVLPLY
jgi:hypothetical protein